MTDSIEIARRKLQEQALNPLIDEAFKQLEAEVAEKDAEIARLNAQYEQLLVAYDRQQPHLHKDCAKVEREAMALHAALAEAIRRLANFNKWAQTRGHAATRTADLLAVLADPDPLPNRLTHS